MNVEVLNSSCGEYSRYCFLYSWNGTIDRISKRLPQRPRGGRTDIYFTRASKPAGVSTRIRQLLDNDEVKNVTLHALGAAIKSCCDMALKFQSAFNVTLDVRTGTVEVFDDYVPLKAVCFLDSQLRLLR